MVQKGLNTSTDFPKDLPAREGHFLLESGYHTDLWLTLDGLFVSPRDLWEWALDLGVD